MPLTFIDCTITILKTSVYEEVTTKKKKCMALSKKYGRIFSMQTEYFNLKRQRLKAIIQINATVRGLTDYCVTKPTKETFKPVGHLHGKPQSLTASSLFFLLLLWLVVFFLFEF